MTLQLDQRQRAMLLEMGIRVWLREPPPASEPAQPATKTTAPPPPASRKNTPATATPPTAAATHPQAHDAHGFIIAPPDPVYAGAAPSPASGQHAPVWLLFCEAPAASTVSTFMQTAAGHLLDNMLHALQLRHSPHVYLALLSRQAAHSAANDLARPPVDALNASIDQLHPAIILLMGRRPAQLLLQRHEPLGQIRTHIHSIRQTPVVVTYDPSGLLRSPADKARAWADLCLALQTCPPQPAAG